MKFGKYFLAQQQGGQYPPEWSAECVDYGMLKSFLKEHVAPNCLMLDRPQHAPGTSRPSHESLAQACLASQSPSQPAPNGGVVVLDDPVPRLAEVMRTRLHQLHVHTPNFIERLDEQVAKLDAFFIAQTDSLAQRRLELSQDVAAAGSAAKDLLQATVRLENFIFLNFTGICKIMKKHDKMSGLRLSESYLATLSGHAFYLSTGLASLKKDLIGRVVGPAGPDSAKLIVSQSLSTTPEPVSWFPPISGLPSQKIIVKMSGPHGTDIIGALLQAFARYDVQIDDIMFSRLYHNVTCAMLVRVSTDDVHLYNDLALNARKWESELSFEVYDDRELLPPSLQDAPYSDRTKYTATALNQAGLSAAFLDKWTRLLLKFKISVEAVKRMNEGRLCALDLKLSVPTSVDVDQFRAELFQLSSATGTDVALQPDDVFRRSKRLVIMDMDSTLIQQEVIDQLALHHGVVSEVAKITHRAMNGELDFTESLKLRVGLLKGAPVTILDKVRDGLVFTEGAHFLCKALKKLGYKLAVISGGFIPLAMYVKNELGLDYAFANQLKVSLDGKTFVGETVGPIVDGERKAELLEVIAQAESVGKEQVVAIGDGANDLFMLAAAGLGIAFNAKPRVQEKARTRINQKSLKHVLYLLGYSDDDINSLMSGDSK